MQTVQSVDTGTKLDGAIHYELGHIKPQKFPVICLLWHPKMSLLCCQHLSWNLTAFSKLKEKSVNLTKKKNRISSALNILNVLWRFLFSLLPCEELIQPNSSPEDLLNSNKSVN